MWFAKIRERECAAAVAAASAVASAAAAADDEVNQLTRCPLGSTPKASRWEGHRDCSKKKKEKKERTRIERKLGGGEYNQKTNGIIKK